MTLLWALVACPIQGSTAEGTPDADTAWDSGDDGTDSGEDSGLDSGDVIYDLDPPECPPDNGYVGAEPHAARTLSGEGVWTLDFDAEAEARGYADCSYHRAYPLMVEREGHGWQCPDCDWFTIGDGLVYEGYDDCLALISTSEATRTEHLGFGTVDGTAHLFRRATINLALEDMNAVTGSGTESDPFVGSFEDSGEFTDGGTFALSASLELVQGVDESTTIEDVNVPRTEPYECGWETCNPGGPVTDWVLSTGGTFPNARLVDTCGDEVDLWDFWGRYLVIDASSPDCGPCINLAENEAAWVEEMAARGIVVEWVTLLNASLGAIYESPSPDVLDQWATALGSTGPVLADEGFGYTVFPAYLGKEDGMSFPTMIVVNPDMQVLGSDSGFALESSGGSGFTVMEALIEADAATRP
ncbi:hypothetical protein LBMAG42_12590 [Deltaproteobacteria bacterium]|nr:hypothetical protein LBMAG42_12590 [Deltaproteobacteria bacterium]